MFRIENSMYSAKILQFLKKHTKTCVLPTINYSLSEENLKNNILTYLYYTKYNKINI